MPGTTDIGTAERINAHRKLRHLSQRELAAESGCSYSGVTKVLSGHLPASPAFVAACARAMHMDVAELYGQPYKDRLLEDRLDRLLYPVTTAMDLYDLDPDPDIIPRALGELAADVHALGELHDAGAFSVMAERLPGLIEEVRALAVTTGTPTAWDLLAQTYRATYDVGARFAYFNLARVALDRVDWAAQKAGEQEAPLRAMRQYQRSLIHMKQGDYSAGLRMFEAGERIIADAEDTDHNRAVRGQLHLGASLLWARSGKTTNAIGHLAQAKELAGQTGERPDVYWMGWGPTNVQVHEVGVYADGGQPGIAAEKGRSIRPPEGWPPSRVARLWIDVARADLWAGNPDRSLTALQEARDAAPQIARYSPHVHETVAGLVRAKRQAPNSLVGFASWAGVKV